MLRIKLFALFIAFALLALVRPRKCLELLEAADRGVANRPAPLTDAKIDAVWEAQYEEYGQVCDSEDFRMFARSIYDLAQECPLPPAGWRCTCRAGHDGPCATGVK